MPEPAVLTPSGETKPGTRGKRWLLFTPTQLPCIAIDPTTPAIFTPESLVYATREAVQCVRKVMVQRCGGHGCVAPSS
ncbi:hypothetical protein E2C01_038356 [Portunus trituberculatus]|uniref:Uncharacterized protein n=1 Tax=Portunus trituberculatus TaxID=210409 RepID=A0A5B7FIC1_PORTR|nr:hypothetical protein [Portunus trituberculatus]